MWWIIFGIWVTAGIIISVNANLTWRRGIIVILLAPIVVLILAYIVCRFKLKIRESLKKKITRKQENDS